MEANHFFQRPTHGDSSLEFPRRTGLKQSSPARQHNGEIYWEVMFNLRKDQDNGRTLGRALSKGADLGGAFDKYARANVSSIKHSDLGMLKI